MSFTVKVDPIDRDIALMLSEDLGSEGRSRALAAFARDQLAEAQAVNAEALGEVPRHDTFVDGREGAPIESVRPDGTIVFAFDIVLDALEWIGAELVKVSPVRSGRFARSFILLADGVEVPVPGPIPAAERYVFMNTQPYSRKIERGQSPQAPEGVFHAVAAVAKARFSNVASIAFTYASPLLAYVPGGANREERNRFRHDDSRTAAQRRERATRVPAISVRT